MTTTNTNAPDDAHDRHQWTFSDTYVSWARSVVRDAELVERVIEWRNTDRRCPGGAPEQWGYEPLLVAMVLSARTGLSMLGTTFRNVLFKHISATMRRELGLPDPPPRQDKLAWDAVDRVVRHRLQRMLEPMDPSPYPKNQRLRPADFERRMIELTPEQVELRHARLLWFANRVIDMSVRRLPPDVLAQWNGSVALDATALSLFARGQRQARKKNGHVELHSADPDGGWYYREGDHSEGAA